MEQNNKNYGKELNDLKQELKNFQQEKEIVKICDCGQSKLLES